MSLPLLSNKANIETQESTIDKGIYPHASSLHSFIKRKG